MKKWLLVILINILLLSLVSASSTAKIKIDGKEHTFELLSVSQEKAVIKFNNETRTIRNVQNSPYNFETIDSIKGLKYALIEMHYPTYADDVKYINLLILFEKNISNGIRKTISLNDVDYSVELYNTISSSEANLKINGGNDSILFNNVQASPPYIVNNIVPISDLKYVLTSINHPNSIDILFGFEVSLLLECIENWTCSDWDNCSNNQQKRTCNDINNCGKIKSMPSLNQSCTIINTTPICSNECNLSGIKTCFNQSSYKICSNFDNDNCTEWGKNILCSNNSTKMICSGNGLCSEIKEEDINTVISWMIIGIVTFILILIFSWLIISKIKIKKKGDVNNMWR